MNINFYKTLVAVMSTVFCTALHAQRIEGFVYAKDSIPVSGVAVFLNSEKLAETNTEGIFVLPARYATPIKLRLIHPKFYISEVQVTQNKSSFKLSPLTQWENLDEVLLSSLPQTDSTEQQREIIIPTETISAEKFDAYSPLVVVSAINETPGVYIQSGAINTNRITIRGVGSRTLYGTNKIRAYFNGIPVTNGGGETIIDYFDAEDMQSIEIIKGPKATQYGTNLGGTLLLYTKPVSAGQSFFKSNLTLGSYGLIKNTVAAATATEKFSAKLNYDHLQTDGFRENNRYNREAMLFTSHYKFNHKSELSVLVNYVDYFAQIPSSISKTAFEEDPRQAAFTWKKAQGFEDNKKILAGLSLTHRFSTSFSNTSSVFYTYLDHYEPRPFNILDEFTNGYGARTVFSKDFLLLEKKTKWDFGGEFYKDQYNWKTIENRYEDNNGNGSLEGALLSDNVEKRDNLNVFATVTIPFTEKFIGQLGLNFNKTRYSFIDVFNQGQDNKNANRDFRPILAPNINLLYQFSANFKAFANFSRGFNYPSIEETLTPDGIINPELGPEKGYNYEVGSEVFLLGKKLHFQVNAYLLDIKDLLVADRVGDDEYIGRNAGKTEHKGIEIQLSYTQPLPYFGYISPYINAEITDHRFVRFVDGDSDFSGKPLTGVPSKKINGGINFQWKNFALNTNFLHIGKIPLNDANLLYSNKYTVLNAMASYKKELFKNLNMELRAGVNNFTDEKYASSVLINATGFGGSEPRFYYPGMPRNWFGGVKIFYRL